MIVVRLVFQTKWGEAQKAVDQFSQFVDQMSRTAGKKVHGRILTDLSGPFHTVVQELEVESLAEWERMRAAMFSDPEMQNTQATQEMIFEGGRTEYYTLEKSW